MSTLRELVKRSGRISHSDAEWLNQLTSDWQLIADLVFADLVLWIPSKDDEFIAVAHARPSSAATLFYRDFVGQKIKAEWRAQVGEAYETVSYQVGNEEELEEEGEEHEGEEGGEEIMEEVHETAVNLLYALIALHILGVLFETMRHGRGTLGAMIPFMNRKKQ